MSEITKAELMAMIEVQTKTAQQMERIAASLATITADQKELNTLILNGFPKKIIDGLREGCKPCMGNTEATAKTIERMATDIQHTKWIVASVSFIVAVVWVIIKMTGH